MKKLYAILFAMVAGFSTSAMASNAELSASDIGKVVPVEYVEVHKVTQVVVGDGSNTYVMATGQGVEETVWVTGEMANNALPFKAMEPKFPKIFSMGQAANTGDSDGTTSPFIKLGLMEPVTSAVTKIYTSYFQYGGKVYSLETTEPVSEKLTLTNELMAMATVH